MAGERRILFGNNIVDSSEIKEYNIDDYDLESDLGLYLNREAYFRSPNTLICVMKKLEGYLDASGQQTALNDKAIVVSAVLSTPFYWQEFDKEWIKALTDENIPLTKPDQRRPFFRSAQFQNKNHPFRDEFGWNKTRYDLFYDRLIKIINRRSLYSVAIGIDLEDYRRFVTDYPDSLIIFGSSGMFAATLCFLHCAQYAYRCNYDETISYIFDRGDTFKDELEKSFNTLSEDPVALKEWHFKEGGLAFGNKEIYSPIQAADVVAWELNKHIKEAQKASIETEQEMRPSFADLVINNGDFIYYSYEELLGFYTDKMEEIKNEVLDKMRIEGLLDDEKAS